MSTLQREQGKIHLTPFSISCGGVKNIIDVFNNPDGLKAISLGVSGREYMYDAANARVVRLNVPNAPSTNLDLLNGMVFASSGFGYVITCSKGYNVNGKPMTLYTADLRPAPAEYTLMTSPQMFTIGGNFCTFDRDPSGSYVSVTCDKQTYPINPYQFAINDVVYIINTNVQPNVVIGGGSNYTMTASNTQVVINGIQYTIALKQNSLNGATLSGEFTIEQANVVVIESDVYRLDTLNSQIVGLGKTYPLSASGVSYTIKTEDHSFTVTTDPNATTVTIGSVVYTINDNTVYGDGNTYPILPYRSFLDGTTKFNIGNDGLVSTGSPFPLSGVPPYTRSTFTDDKTYTVNDTAAFDGSKYYLISGQPPQFTDSGNTFSLRTDGIATGTKTYFLPSKPNEFKLGKITIFYEGDSAAYDGHNYFALTDNSFTSDGRTYTISGNTAVNAGNSYEIFSQLGQDPYFEVPGKSTYFVNIPVAHTGSATGDTFTVFPMSNGAFTIGLIYSIIIAGGTVTVSAPTFSGGSNLTVVDGALAGGFFVDPVTNIKYTCVVDDTITFIDSNNTYEYNSGKFVAQVPISTGLNVATKQSPTPTEIYPMANDQFTTPGGTTYAVKSVAYSNSNGPYFPMAHSRFLPDPHIAYTLKGPGVSKGYVISSDNEFSVDGNVVYTVNASNVVKSTNQVKLCGQVPYQTLEAGSISYSLDSRLSVATIKPDNLSYNEETDQFTVSYNGLNVKYSIVRKGKGFSARDNRAPSNSFGITVTGDHFTFKDTITKVTFTFNPTHDEPIKVGFVYSNNFFIDILNAVTFYINVPDSSVNAISYLPETTQYGFTVDNKTYLILTATSAWSFL